MEGYTAKVQRSHGEGGEEGGRREGVDGKMATRMSERETG